MTTQQDQRELAEIMQFRDKNNNGMSRKEAIALIMDWTQWCNWKKAENHFDFLIRKKATWVEKWRKGRHSTANNNQERADNCGAAALVASCY